MDLFLWEWVCFTGSRHFSVSLHMSACFVFTRIYIFWFKVLCRKLAWICNQVTVLFCWSVASPHIVYSLCDTEIQFFDLPYTSAKSWIAIKSNCVKHIYLRQVHTSLSEAFILETSAVSQNMCFHVYFTVHERAILQTVTSKMFSDSWINIFNSLCSTVEFILAIQNILCFRILTSAEWQILFYSSLKKIILFYSKTWIMTSKLCYYFNWIYKNKGVNMSGIVSDRKEKWKCVIRKGRKIPCKSTVLSDTEKRSRNAIFLLSVPSKTFYFSTQKMVWRFPKERIVFNKTVFNFNYVFKFIHQRAFILCWGSLIGLISEYLRAWIPTK